MKTPTIEEIKERLATVTKVYETWKGDPRYKRRLEIDILALNFLLASIGPDV